MICLENNNNNSNNNNMKILPVLPFAGSLPLNNHLEGVDSHKNTRSEKLCVY